MSNVAHYRALEAMYLVAPINQFFRPRVWIEDQAAVIEVDVDQRLFHAAMAVHGSTYFKVMDDAAFFAANSIEPDVFVLTVAFTTYLTRPVSSGIMRATGKVVNRNKTQIIAESVVIGSDGKELGRGSGIFVRSKIRLHDAMGYTQAYNEATTEK